jgi:hypothetical protein
LVSGEICPGDAAMLSVSATVATNHNQRCDSGGTAEAAVARATAVAD